MYADTFEIRKIIENKLLKIFLISSNNPGISQRDKWKYTKEKSTIPIDSKKQFVQIIILKIKVFFHFNHIGFSAASNQWNANKINMMFSSHINRNGIIRKIKGKNWIKNKSKDKSRIKYYIIINGILKLDKSLSKSHKILIIFVPFIS